MSFRYSKQMKAEVKKLISERSHLSDEKIAEHLNAAGIKKIGVATVSKNGSHSVAGQPIDVPWVSRFRRRYISKKIRGPYKKIAKKYEVPVTPRSGADDKDALANLILHSNIDDARKVRMLKNLEK